jgi:tRNA (guanine-N7-)-methyltransferase
MTASRYLIGIAAASLARIYLLYPDPWPKVRRHKRRLVSRNAAALQRLLRADGRFIFASDTDYMQWTRDHIIDMAVSRSYQTLALR